MSIVNGQPLTDVLRDLSAELKMTYEQSAPDSSHYQAAYWRMKEANDYAQTRYEKLEKYVFVDGQASFLDIMATPGARWKF